MATGYARRIIILWILAIASPVVAARSSTNSLTKEQAMAALRGALQSIRSYNVTFDVTYRSYTRFDGDVDFVLKGGKPQLVTRGKMRMLRAGEAPVVEQARFRTLLQGTDQRLDKIVGHTGERQRSRITNMDTERVYVPAGRTVTLAAPRPLLVQGCEYQQLFSTAEGRVSLLEILEERKTTHVLAPQGTEQFVVLAADQERGTVLGNVGLKVYLDPAHGFLPGIIECLETANGKLFVSGRTRVTRWKNLQEGNWVPLAGSISAFLGSDDLVGQQATEFDVTVDESKSWWNEPIPPDEFKLQLPAGTMVNDTLRKMVYATGPNDSGKTLEELAVSAKHAFRYGNSSMSTSRPSVRSSSRLRVLWLGGSLVLSLAIMARYYFFLRTKRRQ